MLQQRVEMLEKELEKHGLAIPTLERPDPGMPAATPVHDTTQQPPPVARPESNNSTLSVGLIGRICDRKSQLNTDEVGRLHFFGPTSGLHTAECMSSWFVRWGEFPTEHCSLIEEIPQRLQEYLLDRYWKFQHNVIPTIHKEAFLDDMRSRRCRYYSKGLLYSMFACSARISEFPELRALVLSREEQEGNTEEPYLLKKATTLVEEELRNNASITTVQALNLLSVIYCSIYASDNKGWMDSGMKRKPTSLFVNQLIIVSVRSRNSSGL